MPQEYCLQACIVKRKLMVLACLQEKQYYASMDITEFASMGGKASARGMTAQQRSERASRAALAMWEKKRLAARKPKARKRKAA
jgi:hypothetical protein